MMVHRTKEEHHEKTISYHIFAIVPIATTNHTSKGRFTRSCADYQLCRQCHDYGDCRPYTGANTGAGGYRGIT